MITEYVTQMLPQRCNGIQELYCQWDFGLAMAVTAHDFTGELVRDDAKRVMHVRHLIATRCWQEFLTPIVCMETL